MKPVVFETERLVVRRWAPGDEAGVYALYGDRAVTRWLDTPTHTSLESSGAALRKFVARYESADPTKSWWALVDRGSGTIVGNGGVHPIFDGAETEVGYHIARAHWGRGYATEYAAGAVRYGLEVLGLPKITAVTIPTNHASQRVMQKIGMRRVADVDFQGYWSVRYEVSRPDRQR